MTGAAFALVQLVLLLALLRSKGAAEGEQSAYIPADWGAGLALALLYAAVMLGVVALWARRWRVLPLSPEAAEADPSWIRGPYRFVRHPMRLALLAGALGWCLIYRSPINLALLAVLLGVTLLDARRSDRAHAAAGPTGRAWLAEVRAFVPGLY